MMSVLIIPIAVILVHVLYVAAAVVFGRSGKPGRQAHAGGEDTPKYTIEHIVCFKNETAFVQKKVENCYELENFCHDIHHTFINDNSTDDTPALLQEYAREDRTSIITNTTNRGKNQSQIKAVNNSEYDFLLFTDANVFITPETVENLINGFDDDTGGVTGNVRVTTDLENQDYSGRYWELEKKIKAFQTRVGAVIGFDGGLYCVKRQNYCLTRENELSDFETAFLIFEQKKQTRYIPEARAVELEKRTMQNSIRSRIRACNRVFWSFRRIFKYIRHLHPMVIAHFFFHKLIRYLAAVTFVLFLPVIIYALFTLSPFLLLIFCVPAVFRIVMECIALCIGGLIAMGGTEYKTWTQKKL